jgi:hypothetical protein
VIGQNRVKLFRVGKPPEWFAAGAQLPLEMGAP